MLSAQALIFCSVWWKQFPQRAKEKENEQRVPQLISSFLCWLSSISFSWGLWQAAAVIRFSFPGTFSCQSKASFFVLFFPFFFPFFFCSFPPPPLFFSFFPLFFFLPKVVLLSWKLWANVKCMYTLVCVKDFASALLSQCRWLGEAGRANEAQLPWQEHFYASWTH